MESGSESETFSSSLVLLIGVREREGSSRKELSRSFSGVCCKMTLWALPTWIFRPLLFLKPKSHWLHLNIVSVHALSMCSSSSSELFFLTFSLSEMGLPAPSSDDLALPDFRSASCRRRSCRRSWLGEFFSKHRPSGPMLSISRFVRLSVCLSVCLFVHFWGTV